MGDDKIAIPTYEEIMLPLLKILSDGGIHNYKEFEEKLKEEFNLTEEEANLRLQSGKRIFYDRIGWAATYLKKAGLIESPKRREFKITEEGLRVLNTGIKHLSWKYLMKYENFKEFKTSKKQDKPQEDEEKIEDKMTHLKKSIMPIMK